MKKHKPFTKAYELSLLELRKRGKDFLKARALELGLPYDDGIEVRFFGKPLKVTEKGVFPEDATLAARIISLHYVLSGGTGGPTGEWMSFREAPGGMSYYSVYKKRAVAPLLRVFSRGEELVEAGRRLGWRRGSFGDGSLEVEALPRIPVLVVLWEGDEDLPGEGDVLFDKAAVRYLPSEDLVKLAKIAVTRLIASRRMRDVSP